MIIVKSIKEKPEECRGCRLLDESTYDCLINSESPAYTTLEGQYEHCPIEEHLDINVGNIDTTIHDSIPAETGKNDADKTSGDCISRTQAIEAEAVSKWKKEFREYVDSLDIARDDWKGIVEYIDELPPVQPDVIRCKDCVNYIDKRCVVANHHVAPFSCCQTVFDARRRGEQDG